MNPSDVSRLPLDLWKDLHDVRVLWQFAVLGAGLALAWGVSRLVEPRLGGEDRTLHIGFRIGIGDPESGQGSLRSDLLREILREFRERGIEIPYPQRAVRVL